LVAGPRFASRAGWKLAAALDHFGVVVEGRRCLDIGASTGGFTDCLLQRGAASVVAVDVGRDQLSPTLRGHPAVTNREATDIRTFDPADVGGPFPLVVVDLSFISLCVVAPMLAGITAAGGDLLALVKPQFEVGRENIGRGVVRRADLREQAVARVLGCLDGSGLDSLGVMKSTPIGEHGNHEYFGRFRPQGRS
jgi:23S rRNA (cytidine1920-2'-O)/16S rRNA (cytidine1409-2'-O)-methyltransferase